MKKHFFALLIGCLGSAATAQITLQATSPQPVQSLLNLTAGTKLMTDPVGGSFTIYNMDLSIHRVITLPPVPLGYNLASVSYITETLFDTDPATIEYMMFCSASSPGNFATLIGREDGTVLFSAVPGISLQHGYDGINAAPGIFETDSGAVMLMQADFSSPTEIYSLPGHVPCVSICQPAANANVSVGGPEQLGVSGSIFPNPTDGSVTISYAPGASGDNARIMVHDMTGRVVHDHGLDGSGTYRFDASAWPGGEYTVTLIGKRLPLRTARLVVVR